MNKGTIHPRREVKLQEGYRGSREKFISYPKIVSHRFQNGLFCVVVLVVVAAFGFVCFFFFLISPMQKRSI